MLQQWALQSVGGSEMYRGAGKLAPLLGIRFHTDLCVCMCVCVCVKEMLLRQLAAVPESTVQCGSAQKGAGFARFSPPSWSAPLFRGSGHMADLRRPTGPSGSEPRGPQWTADVLDHPQGSEHDLLPPSALTLLRREKRLSGLQLINSTRQGPRVSFPSPTPKLGSINSPHCGSQSPSN